MAVGTTTDFTFTRNELIERALQIVHELPEGHAADQDQINKGIKHLNAIIREMDGEDNLPWAIGPQPTSIPLQANIFRYTSTEGLPTNIVRPTKISYRNSQGIDCPIVLKSHEQWEDIEDKFKTGEPKFALFVKHRDRASQELIIVPTLSSVSTQSEVTGTDALNYSCIRSHTADTANKPITGANYLLYWEQTGSSGSAWATGTAYTAPELLRLWYARPLFDFDGASDNPDMPPETFRSLLHKLVSDLSDGTSLPVEDRKWHSDRAAAADARLYARTKTQVNQDVHNKADFE